MKFQKIKKCFSKILRELQNFLTNGLQKLLQFQKREHKDSKRTQNQRRKFFHERLFLLTQIVVSKITHAKSILKFFHVARLINKDLITVLLYRELVNNQLKNQKKEKLMFEKKC